MTDPIPLFGYTTSLLEILSFVLSVLCVWLNIRQSIWGWFWAIVSCAMYGVVFYQSRLYGDMGLQLVFIAVSVWGWYQWLRGGEGHTRLTLSTLERKGWIASVLAWGAGYALLAWFLARWTDTDVPHMDGFLTAGSLVAQALMSRKKVENWILWIIVDVFYVGLYLFKNLHLTALLYALFVFMAWAGLRAWQRDLAAQSAQQPTAAAQAA